jgi:ATP-dependent helicase HrpA/adenine-specific DNA-methyltransferase
MKLRKTKLEKKTIRNVRRLRCEATPQERVVWARLKNRQFRNLKFRRQFPIGNYIADFYCQEKKLIIELDGWQHKRERDRKYDKRRSEYFEELEFRVLRFWNNEINEDLEGVFLKIDECL